MLPVNLRATGPLTGRTLLYHQSTVLVSVESWKARVKTKTMSVPHLYLWFMTTCTNISLWCHLLLQTSTRVIFSCHWLKVSRGLLLLFSSWKWTVQNCIKTLVNAHFYRTVIVVTFLIETRPYINISVEMLNQMFYQRIFLDFSADSESMINVLLYPPIITSHGLGAFISFLTVIQYFCI